MFSPLYLPLYMCQSYLRHLLCVLILVLFYVTPPTVDV